MQSLLSAFEASISELNKLQPICSYLNDEVIGEYQLKNTQLKELGLTGGRAIVRFSYRLIDDERFVKLNDEFSLKLQKKLDLEEKFKQSQQQQQQQQDTKIEEAKHTNLESNLKNLEHSEPVKKPKTSSSIINQPMEIDESKCSAFSELPAINNEFANFKVKKKRLKTNTHTHTLLIIFCLVS